MGAYIAIDESYEVIIATKSAKKIAEVIVNKYGGKYSTGSLATRGEVSAEQVAKLLRAGETVWLAEIEDTEWDYKLIPATLK